MERAFTSPDTCQSDSQSELERRKDPRAAVSPLPQVDGNTLPRTSQWQTVKRCSFGTLSSSLGWFLILLISAVCALAEQRFPPPDFENGHQLPVTATPGPRAFLFQYLDVTVLATCLGLASWLALKRRSRKGLAALSIFSLLYFGFWRKGCVCSIGSLQNVSLALADANYLIPLTVIGFFALPLFFALFSGRTFCAAVCPHGALQDLVLLKPTKLPLWLEQGLSILPFIYLGLGVLFAATGSAFIICQYDPFVPIFRMNGRTVMVLAGVGLLLLGTFIGRPFCRFICPYGALLKVGATLSKWRVRVTPNTCTQCRLCEASCPFGALREPENTATSALKEERRRFAFLLALLPLLVAAGGWLGWRFSVPASMLDPTVQLAEHLARAPESQFKPGPLSPDELALERARRAPDEILISARQIRRKFTFDSSIFGAWVGLVVGVKLISLSLRRQRTDYEPDPGECFACARCFEYCPNELVRRGLPSPLIAAAAIGANAGSGSLMQSSDNVQPTLAPARTDKCSAIPRLKGPAV
jgi:polyferredoxin